MKKILSVSIVLVLALSLSTGFLFAGGQRESETGPITLTYWTHEDPNRTPFELGLIAEFEAANPGVTIRRVTHASNRMAELLLTAFAANQGPDIFNVQLEDSYAYIYNERVAPLNTDAFGVQSVQALVDTYVDGTMDPMMKNGNVYGVPLEITNWSIFLNKRIFRDAGLDPDTDYPKTWEEMMDISEQIVIRDGNIILRRGFDFRYPYYLVAMVPMVEQLGGKLISDDGREAIVGEEAWLQFLRYMQEWGPNGRNLGSPTYRNARALFNHDNNDMAMAHTGMYQQARIQAENEEFYDSGDWTVVPFPVFENAVNDVAAAFYGHYWMVNAQSSSRRQEMAWKFLAYMQSHGEDYLSMGLIQPTKALMESDLYKSMPNAEVFAYDMERANVVYHAGNSSRLQETIRVAVESVMLSGISPERAYATLKAQAQTVLDEG
ncbi:ABC transporter substrate-binding protein [Spirochaeta dissipatitropha]